ncbi:60S acidic ribosomal protein P1 [Raphidocelis subcapitata]|uniref:60S acidic ribosomal protein P1 n=1 Tax=Raphidocelis subcapitata TaxID=307507 RepID=A0A2V0PLD6_9CHLO|nr:60S acidic ribosomal protein P1 [Raphidocelis subcapitata]|eukprot:GBG00619.1 60S acidic ribosomal protein P1 [Raphidocelis subcapitata]
MSTSELACTYAALILADDGLDVTADGINSILKAAGIEVEPYWPSLFAKFFASNKVMDLISNVGAAAVADCTPYLLP